MLEFEIDAVGNAERVPRFAVIAPISILVAFWPDQQNTFALPLSEQCQILNVLSRKVVGGGDSVM